MIWIPLLIAAAQAEQQAQQQKQAQAQQRMNTLAQQPAQRSRVPDLQGPSDPSYTNGQSQQPDMAQTAAQDQMESSLNSLQDENDPRKKQWGGYQ